MLHVLLALAFHREDVSVIKADGQACLLSSRRPFHTEVKSSRGAQRERYDHDVADRPLEQHFVVGVPTDRHGAVEIIVHIA